ncbi:hypothetical protein CSA37_06670 [Candidatus Fermentibacteria bacterium]|nr:MAG: hypothetical protein CSA37_06670 [Candidatus Fermentibacteria bacterium]
MLRDSLIIFRKEMRRVFTDRRMLFFLVVLPAVMLPVMYWFMGRANQSRISDIREYTSAVAVCSGEGSSVTTDMILASMEPLNVRIILADEEDVEAQKEMVTEGDIELLMIIPDSSDISLESNEPVDISLFHNSTLDYSTMAFEQISAIIDKMNDIIVAERITEAGLSSGVLTAVTANQSLLPDSYDLAAEGSMTGKLIGMMVPFFVIIYLFANSMKVGLDIVAGEKERGTLSILLVNQVGRLSIVLGKMFTVMTAAITGAACSAVGLHIGSRSLIDMYSNGSASLSEYAVSPENLIQFAVVVLPLAVLISSMILVVSTWARNIKEGQGLITPVYIAIMILGMTTMQSGDIVPSWMRIAPLYNSLVILKDIFMNKAVWSNVFFAAGSSAVFAGILIFITLRMFNSEKILFRV